MTIAEFINLKIDEMRSAGYKDVEFLSASECTLVKNGTKEGFLFEGVNVNQLCSAADLSTIGTDDERKGVKIRIWGILKRKRKGQTEVFYADIQQNA